MDPMGCLGSLYSAMSQYMPFWIYMFYLLSMFYLSTLPLCVFLCLSSSPLMCFTCFSYSQFLPSHTFPTIYVLSFSQLATNCEVPMSSQCNTSNREGCAGQESHTYCRLHNSGWCQQLQEAVPHTSQHVGFAKVRTGVFRANPLRLKTCPQW